MKPFDIFKAPFNGINLVESSAGTGKTYTITGLYVRMIAESDLNSDQILVMTFTNAATRELRARIGLRLRDAALALENGPPEGDDFLKELCDRHKGNQQALDRIRTALSEIDSAAVYTIHGFCRQALQEFVFESSSHFDTGFSGNTDELNDDALDDLWRELIGMTQSGERWQRELSRYMMHKVRQNNGFNSFRVMMLTVTEKPYVQFSVQPNPDEIGQKLQEIRDLLPEVQKNWEPEKILELVTDGSLKVKHFGETPAGKLIQQLDNLIQKGDILSLATSDALSKLTPGFIMGELKKNKTAPHHPFFDTAKKVCSVDVGFILENWYGLLAEKFRSKLVKLKRENRIRSFNDMLVDMRDALQMPQMRDKIRETYPVALVDEFQDTDPIQLDIFNSIYQEFPKGCLYLIGDPKQSIYQFRGADIFSYLRISGRSEVQKYTLGKNYRSAKGLVNAVNELFDAGNDNEWPGGIGFFRSDANKADDEFILPDTENKSPVQFLMHESADPYGKGNGVEAAVIAAAKEIAHLTALGSRGEAGIRDTKNNTTADLRAGDIAVLVTTHTEAEKLKQQLLTHGVRSVHKSNQSVFDTDECDFLLNLLRLLGKPGNIPLLRMFLFDDYIGLKLSELNALEENADGFSEIVEELRLLKIRLETHGFMSMLRTFFRMRFGDSDVDAETRILSLDQAERRYTNLMHLAELITDFERENQPGLEELYKWLLQKKQDRALDETEIRLDSDDDLVQIITIHSAKGLEFPVVFCPFLWHRGKNTKSFNPPYVYQYAENEKLIDFTGFNEDVALQKSHQELTAENIRLAYVAATRARYRCYISVLSYKPSHNNDEKHGPLTFMLSKPEVKTDFMSQGPAVWHAQYTVSRAQELAETHSHLFAVSKPRAEEINLAESMDQTARLSGEARSYSRKDTQVPSWVLTSYSGLKHDADASDLHPMEEKSDPAISETDQEAEKDAAAKPFSIFAFEKGARSGVFMHRLFEDLEFTRFGESGKEFIRKNLEADGYDLRFEPAIYQMMQSAFEKKLPESGARLGGISDAQCLKEMEFYFSFKQAGAVELENLISGKKAGRQSQMNGFMSGFIDLLFEYDGKYFILDYKSDFLGNDPEDYHPEKLKTIMQERGYDLQYHIYTVALVRFLKSRMGDAFNYERHVGGAYYLFLRGMESGSSENGIFFDRPSAQLTATLDSHFEGRKHAKGSV